MKGLLKVLSPFAPDQSGATSVFYDMNSITVICDAGGCTGNICGFDEPRWTGSARPIFSAGLRDMDAILGRDDRLVEKLAKVTAKTDADFAVIVGTPVPAVIATDMKALKRMAEKKCDIPVIALDCTGTNLYDAGEEKAYMALMKQFAEPAEKVDGRIGILGATPLNLSDIRADELLKEHYGDDSFCYGMGSGLNDVKLAASVNRNIVLAPSGLAAARYLRDKYGIPYECECPVIGGDVKQALHNLTGQRVLVIHQQIAANTVRSAIESDDVTVASFFMMDKELMQEGDVHLDTEQQFIELIENGNYDAVICDSLLRRAVNPDSCGEWIDYKHFAVSGNLEEALCVL